MNKRKVLLSNPIYEIPNNAIHTGKYNAFNFLPKNLFWQFSKLANFYFLVSNQKIIPNYKEKLKQKKSHPF
jgi:hypothetical protein